MSFRAVHRGAHPFNHMLTPSGRSTAEMCRLNSALDFPGLTPRDVSQQLERCGYHITERRLTNWRQRDWLPPLDVRRGRGTGAGRGARYAWRDPDMAGRVLTLLSLLQLRGRMDSAVVLAWFAGYRQESLEQMRSLWADFEERPWSVALAGAVDPPEIAQAVDDLVWTAERERTARHHSPEFVRALIRFDVDPAFHPLALGPAELERIHRDLASLNPQADALMHGLRPEQLKSALAFLHEYWSAPRLVELIRNLSLDDLAAVRRDCEFVLVLYRNWLRHAIAAPERGQPVDRAALWLAPRVTWQLGRWLMLADIALRRFGLGAQVAASLGLVAAVAQDTRVRRLLPKMAGPLGVDRRQRGCPASAGWDAPRDRRRSRVPSDAGPGRSALRTARGALAADAQPARRLRCQRLPGTGTECRRRVGAPMGHGNHRQA